MENSMSPNLKTNPTWPTEILRIADGRSGDNNRRRPKKHRGKRAGVQNRLRCKANHPSLPCILLANVQSLENKLDDIRVRTTSQWDIRDCNILCFTETWLTPLIPDYAITPARSFFTVCTDRTEESGKSKGGVVCFMTNNKWCDPKNVATLSQSCLEHLIIMCQPFYLPWEFTSVIITAVYIPPQASTNIAESELQEVHPGAAFIVAGDFN